MIPKSSFLLASSCCLAPFRPSPVFPPAYPYSSLRELPRGQSLCQATDTVERDYFLASLVRLSEKLEISVRQRAFYNSSYTCTCAHIREREGRISFRRSFLDQLLRRSRNVLRSLWNAETLVARFRPRTRERRGRRWPVKRMCFSFPFRNAYFVDRRRQPIIPRSPFTRILYASERATLSYIG